MACELVQNINKLVENTINFSRANHSIDKLLKICDKNLKIFKLHSKKVRNTAMKNCLTSAMAVINTIYENAKRRKSEMCGRNNSSSLPNVNWSDIESAFSGRIRTGCINNLQHRDPINFIEEAKVLFITKIKDILKKYTFLKVWTTFCGEFIKYVVNESEVKEIKYFTTKTTIITEETILSSWYDENVKNILLQELEEFQVRKRFYYKFSV